MTKNKKIIDYNKRQRFYSFTIWILVGVIVVYGALFSYINGLNKIAFSVDNNDIYEIDRDLFATGYLKDTHYAVGTEVMLNHDKVKYLRVVAKGIDNTDTKLSFYGGNLDDKGNFKSVFEIKKVGISEGLNYYKLPTTEFTYAAFNVDGMEKNVIQSIQFRQSEKEIDYAGAIPFTAAIFALYILVTLLAYFLYKKYYLLLKDNKGVQYGILSRCKDIEWKSVSSGKARSTLRVALFSAVITASYVLNMLEGEKGYRTIFHKYFILQVIFMLLITALMFCEKAKENNSAVDKLALSTCALLALYTFFSDILVDKTFRFSGIVLFFVLLVYALCWTSRRHEELFIKSFELAAQLFLIISLLLLLLFNDEIPDGRYSGSLSNQSIYALYMGGMWALLLGSMENHIINKSSIAKKTITIAELALVFILALSTQALTPIIAMAIVAIMMAVRTVSQKKGSQTASKMIIIAGVSLSTVLLLILFLYRKYGMFSDLRLVSKLTSGSLSAFLSGRDYYWKEYLRHMNLFGHSKRPFLWDHRILPHNALIGVAYMYGVPCVVPYIIMMIMAVEKSWRYANTGLKYAAVPFYSIISFIIMSMADNVEQPFVWLPWIACYLMMASILVKPVEEIEALRKANIKMTIGSDANPKLKGMSELL